MCNTRRLVTLWFVADMVLALLPPLYWWAGGPSPSVFGIPLSMAYFLAIGTFISASVVFAYVAELRDGSLR